MKQEWIDPDDAPDLSTPYWRAKFAAAPVQQDPVETFHLVPHEDVPRWLRLGWVNLGPAPAHHGVYSCVLLWPFEREAEVP